MHDIPLRPSAALIAYAEPHIAGRRVLVFGDATSGLAEQLLDRGARLVHMYDPDPARVAEAATRNTESRVSLAALSESGLASREGAFDCAIVEDLGSLPNRSAALRALRRALSSRGIAVIAAPNPDAERRLIGPQRGSDDLDYYGLYDAVASELDHVRMLGQTPFVGYAIVDFAPQGEPEPAFDSSFVPGGAEEPEQYIALASMQETSLDEMTIVQLPLARVSLAGLDESALKAARSAERRAQKRVSLLEAELRKSRQSGDDLERLQNELDKRDSWIRELENRAATADARADDAEAELDALRERLDEVTAQLAASQEAAQTPRQPAPPPPSEQPSKEEQKVVEGLREELDELRRVTARTQKERQWAEDRVRKLQEELEAVLREMEEVAAAPPGVDPVELQEQVSRLERSLGDNRRSLEQLAAKLKTAEAQIKSRDAEVLELREALSNLEQERRLAAAREEQELRSDTQRDLERMEKQLAERGRHVVQLEEQLRKLERYGRTLVEEIQELRAAGDGEGDDAEELQTELDRLAALHAAREADLVAAEWVIAELRDKLAEGAPPQVVLHRAKQANGGASS